MISGKGKMFKLDIDLAAGHIYWKKSNMPIHLQLASGTIKWEAAGWPKNQKSTISVASGSVLIESPKKATVTTHISNSIGSTNNENDFSAQHKGYHQLLIEMAAGKVIHEEEEED